MSVDSNQDKGEPSLFVKKAAETMFAAADPMLFKRAAELRNLPTHAEVVLWGYLRTKPNGFKFRRQHPFLNYILDFYCHALHLVIEVDGPIHDTEDAKENDAIRQKQLEDHGLIVLRFTNDEVENTLENVMLTIEHHLCLKAKTNDESPSRSKSPL